MRIRVSHQTVYDYDPPAKSLIQTLRLTPRNHDGQYVVHWRIDVDIDARLKPAEDAFGNATHGLSVAGPVERLSVRVDGEVETHDTAGVVRGTIERFPPIVFLRETPLTMPDEAIAAFATDTSAAAGPDTLTRLHALKTGLNAAMNALPPRDGAAASAAAAFAAKAGVAQDFAHVFVTAARRIEIPARYVSGYRCDPGEEHGGTAHAWAEAYVEGLGWVAFDAVHDVCPSVGHVRVAIGLDADGAAPVRGTRFGGGHESLDVSIRLTTQGQSQS
ncbi:transglutaminase family protein [Alsobacter sp. R-9]